MLEKLGAQMDAGSARWVLRRIGANIMGEPGDDSEFIKIMMSVVNINSWYLDSTAESE